MGLMAAFSLDCVLIDRVSEFRFLGVITDDKMTWRAHIAQVKSKLYKNIFVLNKAVCVKL